MVTHHSDEGAPRMEWGGDRTSQPREAPAATGRTAVSESTGRGKTQRPMTRPVGKQEGVRAGTL